MNTPKISLVLTFLLALLPSLALAAPITVDLVTTTGLSLQVDIYDGDTEVFSDVAMTESPAGSGHYVLTNATVAALPLTEGTYTFKAEDAAGTPYGAIEIDWSGTARRRALKPTVADRTLDLLSTGEAAADVTHANGLPIDSDVPRTLLCDTTATGDSDGSGWTDAFPTLAGAISAAEPGDRIICRDGQTHVANITISEPITIEGVITIDPASGNALTISSSGVRLFGITSTDPVVVGVFNAPTIERCNFSNYTEASATAPAPIVYSRINGVYYDAYVDVRTIEGTDATDQVKQSLADSWVDNSLDETMFAKLIADLDNVPNSLGAALASTLNNSAAILDDTGTAGVVLANDAITAAKIAANAITSSELADDTITAAKIASAAIGSDEIATDAIGASEIATDAIGAAELAADSIGASEIATDAIGALEIAANAITSAELSTDAIGSDEISATAAGEIADANWEEALADHSGTSGSTAAGLNSASSAGDPWATLLPGAYGAGTAGKAVADILDDTGTSGVALPNGAIDASTLTQAAIDAIVDDVYDEPLSGHVTAGTGGKAFADILDDTGTSGVVLVNDAITAAKIAADAIGNSEIAADALGASELADNAIDAASIATGAFTTDEFAATALSTQTSLASVTQFGTVTATFGTWLNTEMDTIATNMDATISSRSSQTSVDDVPTNTELTTALSSLATAASITALNDFDPTNDTVVNVTNVATLTGHTPQTGDSFARLGSPTGASISADIQGVGTASDWTADQKTAIQSILGFSTGPGVTDPSTGILDTIRDSATNIYNRIGAPAGASISADIAAIDAGDSQFTADRVNSSSTFKLGSEGHQASNIISLNAWTTGTRTLGFDLKKYLNESDTTLNTVVTVTVVNQTTAASITTSNLRKHQNGVVAMWDTAACVAGDYDVTVTFTTLDTNTVVVTGELQVE